VLHVGSFAGDNTKNTRTFLLSESIHGVVKFLEWFGTAISASVENVLPTVLRRLSLIEFALALALSSPAAEVEVAPIKGGQFVGVAGCKSSSCHGGAGEKRNQYLTWQQKDFHARSYAILTDR
jgi:hypothetical protein